MNCKRAKKLLLLHGELPKASQQELNLHLQSCNHCTQEFRALQNSVQLCRAGLKEEEPKELWSGYWERLSRRLHKPSFTEIWGQRVKSGLGLVSRSVWGPVPAYAVVAAVLLLSIVIWPISKSDRTRLAGSSPSANSLVVSQGELVSATSQGSVTVYLVARR